METHPDTDITRSVSQLETILGYSFTNPTLLERALTHSSAANERRQDALEDNEQLEFLGDSILGFFISDFLFRSHPHLTEGQLSKIRAHLVSSASLLKIASRLRLGQFLYLGRGEEKTGGREKPAILVDAFEAIIAAIYLDGGLAAARQFVVRHFRTDMEAIDEGSYAIKDYKSQLQERLQALRFPPAEYSIIRESGPDHKKYFSVELRIKGCMCTEGHGDTKKGAEQEAARLALESLPPAKTAGAVALGF